MVRKVECFVCYARAIITQNNIKNNSTKSTISHTCPTYSSCRSRNDQASVSFFHKQIESQERSKDEVLHNAFMAVYWLAKEEMGNKKFSLLLKLLEMLGLEKMKHFQPQDQPLKSS